MFSYFIKLNYFIFLPGLTLDQVFYSSKSEKLLNKTKVLPHFLYCHFYLLSSLSITDLLT